MSKRWLYFTQHQVYFECNMARCCESLDDSKSALHDVDEAEGVTDVEKSEATTGMENLLRAFQRQRFMWQPGALSFDTTFRIRDYGSLLTEYSQRKMTHKSDVINAFGAVIQQMTHTIFRRGFFWGIPIEILQYALLWEHFGKTERREGFPSWSWAGWIGYIWPAYSNRMAVGIPAEVALRAFKTLEDGHLEPIYEIDSSISSMLLCKSKEKDPVLALGDECMSPPPVLSHNPQHLIIDGVTLRLKLPRVTSSSTRRLRHPSHPEWLKVFLGLPKKSDPDDFSNNVEPETESITKRSSWLLEYLRVMNDKEPQAFLLMLRKWRPPKVRYEFLLLRPVEGHVWDWVAAMTWFLDFQYLKELEHPDFGLKREWLVLR
jgi:hypothetical protein